MNQADPQSCRSLSRQHQGWIFYEMQRFVEEAILGFALYVTFLLALQVFNQDHNFAASNGLDCCTSCTNKDKMAAYLCCLAHAKFDCCQDSWNGAHSFLSKCQKAVKLPCALLMLLLNLKLLCSHASFHKFLLG